jgi:hypothetical protein
MAITLPNERDLDFAAIVKSIFRIRRCLVCSHWRCACLRFFTRPSVKANGRRMNARCRQIEAVFSQAMANGESIPSLDFDMLREKLDLSPTPGYSLGLIEPS